PTNTLGGTSFGTNIYGPSGSGLDGSTPGYTMRGWNYTTKAYANVTNTTTEELYNNGSGSSNKPYMLYVRGDKDRTPTNGQTSSARLRAVGLLQTGNQPFNYTANTNDYVPFANPYACAINWESMVTDGSSPFTNVNQLCNGIYD
ncbi:MAG: hypothetical protein ACOVOV_07280, partial [Dolichospermum sp.]